MCGPDGVPSEGALRRARRAGAAGRVADDPAEAAAAAERIGGPVVVKAQVKTGGRGKAGGVKLAASPDEAAEKAARSSAWTSRATRSSGDAGGPRDIAEEYYVSFLLDRANRTYLAMASVEGGMEIEQVARTARGAGRRSRSTRSTASTPRRPPRSSPPPVPGRRPRPGRRRAGQAVGACSSPRTPRWSRSTRWSRRPTARSSRSTARSPWTRTRTSGTRTTRASTTRPPPIRWRRGQGEGPQLRQARRRGRHHRQRRRPGHVHARRRRVRRRGVRRGQAGELPRHRRRRIGRGDGQRAGDHPVRPGRCGACS